VVDDISHEGLRILLREEGASFQRLKTWKTSRDPDYAAKKARAEHLYAIADGEVIPEDGEPDVLFCMDEFGPLNLMPHPGRQWAERGGSHKDPDREPGRRRWATYNRYGGVRHLFAAPAKDKLYGHVKPVKRRTHLGGDSLARPLALRVAAGQADDAPAFETVMTAIRVPRSGPRKAKDSTGPRPGGPHVLITRDPESPSPTRDPRCHPSAVRPGRPPPAARCRRPTAGRRRGVVQAV
jgi:hypothetical protein